MKNFIFVSMMVLNVIFALVIKYEHGIYKDEYKRAEFCRENSNRYLNELTALKDRFRNQL